MQKVQCGVLVTPRLADPSLVDACGLDGQGLIGRLRRTAAPRVAGAAAIAALVAVAGSACGGGGPRPAPTSTPGAASPTAAETAAPNAFQPTFSVQLCDFVLPHGQKAGENVSCGTLTVPERHDGGSGRTLRLGVAILRATNADKSPDPIIYLAGGPGAPALEYDLLAFTADLARPLQQDRDIIFLDQRGVGRSRPSLTCWEFDRIYFSLNNEADPAADAVQECRDRLAGEAALDSFNSVENALDIIDLADALGIERYNLYGVSYGTRLALTAMRDAPERVRSVVLDSAYPPPANFYLDRGVNLEVALNGLFDLCAATPECAASAPGLRSTFISLVAAINADPAIVLVQDYGTGQYSEIAIDGAGLLDIMFYSFYGQATIPFLPAAISMVAQGDTRPLSLLASGASEAHQSDSLGMYLSVQCREEGPFNQLERVVPARTAGFEWLTEYARLDAQRFAEDCARWAVAPAAPIEGEPVHSDIPTLVLAGSLDAVTPPSYGRMAAETLTRSTVVEFPGFGHGVLDAGCPMDMVARFFADPAATVDAGCVAGMPAVDFTGSP